MAYKVRNHVAAAITSGADSMRAGSGKGEVKRAEMYLDDIQKHLGRTINADGQSMWGARVWYVEEDPGGDAVTAPKKRDGVFAVTDQVFIVSRDVSMFSTQTLAFGVDTFTAEPVLVTHGEATIASVRLKSKNGNEGFLFSIRPIPGADAANRRSLRDTFVRRFAAKD